MKTAITITLPKPMLQAARAHAAAARRTLSAQMEQWIEEKLTTNRRTRKPNQLRKGDGI